MHIHNVHAHTDILTKMTLYDRQRVYSIQVLGRFCPHAHVRSPSPAAPWAQIKDTCAVLCGLVVAQDYKRGQQLVTDRSFADNAAFFQVCMLEDLPDRPSPHGHTPRWSTPAVAHVA